MVRVYRSAPLKRDTSLKPDFSATRIDALDVYKRQPPIFTYQSHNSSDILFSATIEKNNSKKETVHMKLISWNIDSLNAALTGDSARAQLSRAVIDTLAVSYTHLDVYKRQHIE